MKSHPVSDASNTGQSWPCSDFNGATMLSQIRDRSRMICSNMFMFIITLTYNVQGLGDERKLRHLLHFMQGKKGGKNLDFIACLQETYIEKSGKIPFIWRGNYFLTPGNGHSYSPKLSPKRNSKQTY